MSVRSRNNEDDNLKAFLSRVPTILDESNLYTLLQKEFGADVIVNVSVVKGKTENEDEANNENSSKNRSGSKRNQDQNTKGDPESLEPMHKGCAFVVFSTTEARDAALEKGSFKWDERGENSKKKRKLRTIYIGPIVRDSSEVGGENNGVCYLWKLGRCTHGASCKFAHTGEGSCAPNCNADAKVLSYGERMKKRKCFAFKKTGKCKAGDKCPYSHDFVCKFAGTVKVTDEGKNILKHCINWKTKGKCRKGEQCPYLHDPALRDKVIKKKEMKKKGVDENGKKRKDCMTEKRGRQPLSIRVFGLNYDTTEERVRNFFADCGPIVELTFPKFEDSGRSKGFCGILFQSPKAVEKAVALDGLELDGRWLSVQAGKMYLRQWEENIAKTEKEKDQIIGEFGQKVKRRKRHGHKE